MLVSKRKEEAHPSKLIVNISIKDCFKPLETLSNARASKTPQKKIPIERIAKHQGLKAGTIINHIEKLIDAGENLDLEYLKLPLTRYDKISKAFDACGDELLKPVFEHLDGLYDYDEIKLARELVRVLKNWK